MDECKQALMDGYRQYPEWKIDSDKLFGPDQAQAVWSTIQKYLTPSDHPLVVVGVSENIPTHMAAMYQLAGNDDNEKVHFLAGDIARFELTQFAQQEQRLSKPSKSTFHGFQWDAEHLPFARGSIDVLFDRAGWLWHCAKEYKDETRLMNTFIQYYELLKPGGILVIDAVEGFKQYEQSLDYQTRRQIRAKMQSGVYYRPSALYTNPPGQYQPSTIDVIQEVVSADFWFYIERFFTIAHCGEGVTKVMVLKKKVVSANHLNTS